MWTVCQLTNSAKATVFTVSSFTTAARFTPPSVAGTKRYIHINGNVPKQNAELPLAFGDAVHATGHQIRALLRPSRRT